MKFGKQLEAELIPEWQPKYLDYKRAKKKLRVVARAIRSVNQTPRTPFARAQKLLSSPVPRRVDRDTTPKATGPSGGTRTSNEQSRTISCGTSNENVKGNGKPTKDGTPSEERRDEHSPLRGNNSTKLSVHYGAISYSDGGTRRLSISEGTRSKLPSLRLPDPAINLESESNVERDLSQERGNSTRLVDRERSAGQFDRASGNIQASSSCSRLSRSPSYHVPSFLELKLKSRKLHANSLVFRLRNTLFAHKSPSSSTQQDIQLEASREYDRRQADFFHFLDNELRKIEAFYCERERESSDRLISLREQLLYLQDLRHKEVRQSEGKIKDKYDGLNVRSRSSAAVIVEDEIDTGYSSSRPRFRNIKQHSQEPRGKLRRHNVDLASFDRSHPEPRLTSLYSQSDYVRSMKSADISYKAARRVLKYALIEYYRSLELLRAYALLNGTGFRKITKKYNKTIDTDPSDWYMLERVNKARFVDSNVVDNLMRAVEDLYARYFGNSNRKVALAKLKSKSSHRGDHGGSNFRNGMTLAAGLLLGVEGLANALNFLNDHNELFATRTSLLLQLYAGYFLILLLMFMFCFDCRLWYKSRINYVFVFEYDTRHHLDWRQLFEFPCLFLFLLGLSMWLNFRWLVNSTLYQYYPIILIGVTLLIIFLPLPIFYFRSRLWLLHTCWRLFWAGLYPVEFRDFFLGDLLCSQTYSFGNIVLFFCLYGHQWENPSQCRSSNSRLLGFFTALPAIWRAFQCIRRFHDARNVFPHLANFGKYFCTILFYMSLSLYRIDQTSSYKSFFIFCATVNAAYTSIWDLVMDWSLINPFAPYPLLRETLAFKQVWAYYVAIVLDPILRFTWVFFAIFAENVQHSALLSILVSTGEVLRRGMWTLFRVENEHCTNVGRFRAYRDIPLPFDVSSPHQNHDRMNEDGASDRPLNEHTSHITRPTQTRKYPRSLSESRTRPASATATAAPSPARDIEQQGKPATDEARARTHFTEASQSTTTTTTTPSTGLSHIGNVMHSAHAQDFERRRKPTSLSSLHGVATPAADNDDDNDNDDDDENNNIQDIDDDSIGNKIIEAAAASEEGIGDGNAAGRSGAERRRRGVDLEGNEMNWESGEVSE